jgi:hypothetical protein
MKTKLILLIGFLFCVVISFNDFGSRYMPLLILLGIGTAVIVIVLMVIQRKSGETWNQTGERAKSRLRNSMDGNLSDEDLRVRMELLGYDEYGDFLELYEDNN